MLSDDSNTLFPIACSSPEDLEYHCAFREDSFLLPYFIRLEEANCVLKSSSGMHTKQELPKTSDFRNSLHLHLPTYHEEHPSAAAFFLTINTPPDTGITESYLRVACLAKKIHNIPEKVTRGAWSVGYVMTGVETHKGREQSFQGKVCIVPICVV